MWRAGGGPDEPAPKKGLDKCPERREYGVATPGVSEVPSQGWPPEVARFMGVAILPKTKISPGGRFYDGSARQNMCYYGARSQHNAKPRGGGRIAAERLAANAAPYSSAESIPRLSGA